MSNLYNHVGLYGGIVSGQSSPGIVLGKDNGTWPKVAALKMELNVPSGLRQFKYILTFGPSFSISKNNVCWHTL